MEPLKIFKKGAEIFRWGPIPGRYFYTSEYNEATFTEYPKLYKGARWPDGLFLFNNRRMVWANDFEEIRMAGRDVFKRYMLNKTSRAKLKNFWYKRVKILSNFERRIEDLYLEDLTDEQLYDLWQKFDRIIIDFFVATIPAELGNYGAGKLLEEKLAKQIKDKNELSSAMEILTAPEERSFYQQEEVDLERVKDLGKHAKKYFWLRNSYNGTEELQVDFFAKRKKELPTNIRELIEERVAGIRNKKGKMIRKYKLSGEIKDIAKAICAGIEWQDERKKYIFTFLHYKELFLREVARRFHYDIDLLRNCSSSENMDILEKRGVHALIEKRSNNFGFFLGSVTEEFTGQEAALLWDAYSKEKIDAGIKEVAGIVVSPGKEKLIKGKVKIIHDPKEGAGFEEGDILVATMTSPEYIFLIKKSKAVITDAGGLTSHAAIVSRELNIPCIVGTKIATQVFKDGDMVEVDANKGTVKIIK